MTAKIRLQGKNLFSLKNTFLTLNLTEKWKLEDPSLAKTGMPPYAQQLHFPELSAVGISLGCWLQEIQLSYVPSFITGGLR